MQNYRVHFLVLPLVLLLIGAGCISSSSVIKRDIGNYAYSGKTQSGIDKQGEVSFATENTEYTSPSHTVEMAVFTAAIPGEIDQYLQEVFLDEEEDGEKFSELAVGEAQVYYRRDQNQNASCLFTWPSEKSMVVMRGVPCDVQDKLIKTYVKKFPPRAILK